MAIVMSSNEDPGVGEPTHTSARHSDDIEAGVPLSAGTRVDIRNEFLGRWTRGFEVAGTKSGRYSILRLSDRSILPGYFSPRDVRPERRRQGLWWY